MLEIEEFSEYGTDVLDQPNLISQETVGEHSGGTVDRLTYEVDAVNELRARTIVRRYVRTNNPLVKNILEPEITNAEDTEQGTISQFFPEQIQQQRYNVKILVVR